MYSPPPLDGFSPPPMSDVSPLREYPPPINGFSENGDDEEELDYDFTIDDAEYDLTGLSDKLSNLLGVIVDHLVDFEVNVDELTS